MPDTGIIALDNGVYKIWFALNYDAHAPNTVLLDNALATMGAGLPSAMGAHLVHPDRRVMAICGDGGFPRGGAIKGWIDGDGTHRFHAGGLKVGQVETFRLGIADFVDDIKRFPAASPNTFLTAMYSISSPSGVEVPWALM